MFEHLCDEEFGLLGGRLGKTSRLKTVPNHLFLASAIRRRSPVKVLLISLPATAKNMLETYSMTMTEVPSATWTMCQSITSSRPSRIWVFLPRPSSARLGGLLIRWNQLPRDVATRVKTKALRNYQL